MKTRSIVGALLLATAGLACAEGDRLGTTTAAIVDGEFADEAAFDPAVAVIRTTGTCSGTLIAVDEDGRGFVLTAAHCVDEDFVVNGIQVSMGPDYLRNTRNWFVTSAHVHPDYTFGPADDIAVLVIEGVPLDTQAIAYPAPGFDTSSTEDEYLLVGYGRTDERELEWNSRRKRAIVDVVGMSDSGTSSQRVDGQSCGGDSGGSLLRRTPDGGFVLAGVHHSAAGDRCGPGGTMFAARPSYYHGFISSVTGGLGVTSPTPDAGGGVLPDAGLGDDGGSPMLPDTSLDERDAGADSGVDASEDDGGTAPIPPAAARTGSCTAAGAEATSAPFASVLLGLLAVLLFARPRRRGRQVK